MFDVTTLLGANAHKMRLCTNEGGVQKAFYVLPQDSVTGDKRVRQNTQQEGAFCSVFCCLTPNLDVYCLLAVAIHNGIAVAFLVLLAECSTVFSLGLNLGSRFGIFATKDVQEHLQCHSMIPFITRACSTVGSTSGKDSRLIVRAFLALGVWDIPVFVAKSIVHTGSQAW